MSDRIQVRLGPSVQVRAGERAEVELRGAAAALVALLVLEGQADRRHAARLFWPDAPEGQARKNLRTLVHRMNQKVGAELLSGTERLVLTVPQAPPQPDIDALLAAALETSAAGHQLLAQAGVDSETSEALQRWLDAARQRQRRQQLAALAQAVEASLAQGQTQRAVAVARACVQLEPLSEHWHRQLMDTLARCGDRAAALAAYEDCKERLHRQLGVMPDLQTRTLQLRILQGQAGAPMVRSPIASAARSPSATSAAGSMAGGLTPLGGAARYPLVEREAALAEIQAALAKGQHVVLHGEAGVGKTRLLRHLAEQGEFEQVAVRLDARQEPYAALAQLLQEVQPRWAPHIGPPEQVELARLAPTAFPDVQPSQASLSTFRLHAALRHWAQRLRDAGVKRLVLDDIHHADAASQLAFGSMLTTPGDSASALPLLLAYRTAEVEPGLAEVLLAAQTQGQIHSVALARLTLEGIQALLKAMHAEYAETGAAQLLQRTGGNPLFVIELAQHVLESAKGKATTAAAGNLEALLRARIAACSTAAQQLAAVAAVATQDFSVELAEVVTGQSALALMPAWSELQQRGLFADHGLAHDLVRDAVLAALPPAIGRKLHRQTAKHLEAQGSKGQRVLTHWLAAEDFDRALPHLIHRLYAASASGLSTVHIEKDLLQLMSRLSDEKLLANLWLTAEVDGIVRMDSVLRDEWLGLAVLVARVEQTVRSEAANHWLAYEHARLSQFRDQQQSLAYAELCTAAHRMGEQGIERARTEVLLFDLAYYSLTGDAERHLTQAKVAVAALEKRPEHVRLLNHLDTTSALFFGFANYLKAKWSALRAARKRHDFSAVDAIRTEVAYQCYLRGCSASACRLLRLDAKASSSDASLREYSSDEFAYFGVIANDAGKYADAIRFLDLVKRTAPMPGIPLFRVTVWAHIGQWERSHAQLNDVDVKSLLSCTPYLRAYLYFRRVLDLRLGLDPMPSMREAIDLALKAGVGGIIRQRLEWEVALVSLNPQERVAAGMPLLEGMIHSHTPTIALTRLRLEIAEAHAQAGSSGGRDLIRGAARELRRGRGPMMLYVPEGLVRCAKLLEPTDPEEASALMHVARRWVLQALPNVPDFARESFVNEVPVNRLLLSNDLAPL